MVLQTTVILLDTNPHARTLRRTAHLWASTMTLPLGICRLGKSWIWWIWCWILCRLSKGRRTALGSGEVPACHAAHGASWCSICKRGDRCDANISDIRVGNPRIGHLQALLDIPHVWSCLEIKKRISYVEFQISTVTLPQKINPLTLRMFGLPFIVWTLLPIGAYAGAACRKIFLGIHGPDNMGMVWAIWVKHECPWPDKICV